MKAQPNAKVFLETAPKGRKTRPGLFGQLAAVIPAAKKRLFMEQIARPVKAF
ncbi:MAG: hypothetical protein HZB23_15060 [Deltaproteobacteria bacterium]|nr:hypothetical protein [Deltaproteobacteria bacterium]